jgi:hypothetical protein
MMDTSMRFSLPALTALLAGLAVLAPTAAMAAMTLSADVPACKVAAGPVLPQAYLDLARRDRDFRWAGQVKADVAEAYGDGWERVEGSGMRDGFAFVRLDVDGDGNCDWYLTSSAPQSTGGDRSSFNTLYLWRSGRWLRLGAEVPAGKPDVLGLGRTDAQRPAWLLGESVALLRDSAAGQTWFITWHEARNEAAQQAPGYRLRLWDPARQRLVAQDKWKAGSPSAEVYAYFKAHGARGTGSDHGMVSFDPAIEAAERSTLCTLKSVGAVAPVGAELLPPPHDLSCKL